MNETEKSGAVPPCNLASALPQGSRERIDLVMDRIAQGVCLECGRKKNEGAGDFCIECLIAFPKQIDVGDGGEMLALNGWRYVVIQKGPAIPGLGLFEAVRIGVFERDRERPRLVRICDTVEEAKEAAQKAYGRSLSASAEWP